MRNNMTIGFIGFATLALGCVTYKFIKDANNLDTLDMTKVSPFHFADEVFKKKQKNDIAKDDEWEPIPDSKVDEN